MLVFIVFDGATKVYAGISLRGENKLDFIERGKKGTCIGVRGLSSEKSEVQL